MSDFLDSEADESSDEEYPRASKKARIDSDDEEEEEDEDRIAEEMKDLINDDEEEEEGEDEGDDRSDSGKQKYDSDMDQDLEDEDYELLEENLGYKVKKKPKKLRRIRMISDDDDSGGGSEKEEEHERDVIANELFEDDEAAESEIGDGEESRIGRPSAKPAPPENEFGDLEDEEESDVDDFIVDEEGQPISKKGKKKRHIIHTDKALQEAQDIFGVDFDFDDIGDYGEEYDEEEELEDVYEEEEEGEEGTRPKTKKVRKRPQKKSIFDVFEPSELERGHFTDIDNKIRVADIPERFQLRQVPVQATDEGELEEEAEWIYKQAFQTPPLSVQDMEQFETREGGSFEKYSLKGPGTVEKIREALNFMRNQQFEVPFIAFYRKEYVEPELNINDLWRVWHFDEKWTQLRNRKLNLVKLFVKMQGWQFDSVLNADPDKPLEAKVRPLTEEDIERAKGVQTMEELNDVYQHFLLYYGREIPLMKNALKKKKKRDGATDEEQDDEDDDVHNVMPKQATRKSGYTLCTQSGIDEIARKFGLTPEEFGENLRDNYQRHEVDQFPSEPAEVAKEVLSDRFPTVEDALSGARHMVAMQIAHDPLVRQSIRTIFNERAKISARPTKKGMKEIDESHPCYTFKYLKNKPVKDLQYDQFLKLTMAEEDLIMTYKIEIDDQSGTNAQTYFDEVKQLYYRDEFSKLVQEWNNQRTQALERALTQILYPQMIKELKGKLLQEAKDHVLRACTRKLYHWLKVAPYQTDQQLDDDDEYMDSSNGLKVLGIAFSQERDEAAFCALVDGDGEVTDFLRLIHLMKRRNAYNEDDRKHKEQDMEKLKKFIASKKPHVIAIGADCRDAMSVFEDVKRCVSELEDEQQIPSIGVELLDQELAIIFSNTKKSEAEFREYPVFLRRGISLARRMQDPLVEFSQLCNPDEDILCLKYHPLQEQLNKEELLNALYLEFVNRVNEVGVDVNRCVAHNHNVALIQFVCGLGPRKGNSLIKTLKQHGRLENRAQLVTVSDMGPKVFINCAGFIKIDTNSLGDSTEAYVEVLDGSRVHPETYEWARKMAVDALEYDDTAEDANPAGALEEILESPERLKDLDLDAFAEELERQGYGNKHITLYDIRAELNHRYKDLRVPYRSPTAEERFNLLTRETPQTFYIGKLVMCTVTGIARKRPLGEQLDQANPVRNDETGLWQCPFCLKKDFPELSEVWSHFDAGSCPGTAVGVKTRLDNGVTGFIPTKMISDKHVTNPEDRVQVFQTLHCRITKIDIDRFQTDMTCRSSDLADKEGKRKLQKDLYYDIELEEDEKKKEEEKRKQQARQTYIKRVIVHPSFHNIGYRECEKLMHNMEQGEVVIRPSSKGSDHLTVTWKVTDGISQHIDVLEEGKENAFSLGKTLIVNNEEFEDLDEIIARYIQPMAAHARDIINYKYFVESASGEKDEMDRMCKEEKKAGTHKIPYFVSASKAFPGKFLISYLPRVKTRHEFISVTPSGFKYRNQNFHSIGSLIRWFKDHFRDPIPGTPGGAQRTPLGMSTNIGATPNLHGLDAATIQRAAAGLPSSVFNSLAQVAGATPQQFQNAGNFSGGFGGGFNYNPMQTPMGVTPMMTPSYHQGMTPSGRHQVTPAITPGRVTTPQYQPTPRSGWNAGGLTPRTSSGLTPRTSSGMTPRATPGQRTPSGQRQQQVPPLGPNTDWAKAAQMWAKKKQEQSGGRATPRGTPRITTPRIQPSPRVQQSPMVGEGGDTPLFDER
ncbi:transcription elongation factor SPT6-like [Lineus longissimus]|uniref:transcription elongation factor SPT6-like n=1 Tax=Lineus longissimus TaxID=88925 RepID=UPI00315C9144